MGAAIEIVRRVFPSETCGECIEVGPDGDGLGLIHMVTTDKDSQERFGKIDLVLTKETAKALGQALIAASED